jgi:hypothetical protein
MPAWNRSTTCPRLSWWPSTPAASLPHRKDRQELEEVCPGRTVDWIADPSLDPEVAADQLAARIEVWVESCT